VHHEKKRLSRLAHRRITGKTGAGGGLFPAIFPVIPGENRLTSGIEATKQIKEISPDTIILVLTIYDDNEHVLRILEAGATGYLTKSVSSTTSFGWRAWPALID